MALVVTATMAAAPAATVTATVTATVAATVAATVTATAAAPTTAASTTTTTTTTTTMAATLTLSVAVARCGQLRIHERGAGTRTAPLARAHLLLLRRHQCAVGVVVGGRRCGSGNAPRRLAGAGAGAAAVAVAVAVPAAVGATVATAVATAVAGVTTATTTATTTTTAKGKPRVHREAAVVRGLHDFARSVAVPGQRVQRHRTMATEPRERRGLREEGLEEVRELADGDVAVVVEVKAFDDAPFFGVGEGKAGGGQQLWMPGKKPSNQNKANRRR